MMRAASIAAPLALPFAIAWSCASAPARTVDPTSTSAAKSTPTTTATASAPTETSTMKPVTFDDDVAFLRAHGAVHVLESPSGAKVAVSAKYQGRVMTSAIAHDAPSLGWINRAFIASGKTGTAFDNYGGEDRFWLGPEGGQFALYFAPGKPFVFGEWQTPHALQEGEWTVKESTPASVTFAQPMSVTNWSGNKFQLSVLRTVRLVDASAANAWAKSARVVAFETVNTITNKGDKPWTRETGLVSIWILGMFAPAADARIVVPYKRDGGGEIVNDRYFGKVPADRLDVRDKDACVVFVADGLQRGKIGLSPARATSALASYSKKTKMLTLVTIAAPDASKPYVDNMWEKRADAYKGDAINAYNDGPTEPGKPSLGGFYELESSSPAAELAPGQSLTHTHTTMHVVVDEAVKLALEAGALPVPARCVF